MIDIDKITGIITLTRGDNASFPLYINEGTSQTPLQYTLKDYLIVLKETMLAENSILKKGSVITKDSFINNELILNDLILEDDLTITVSSSLSISSAIKHGSILTSTSILNGLHLHHENIVHKDELFFAIMEPNQVFENAIVKKYIDSSNYVKDSYGNPLVVLEPNDTLLVIPGIYAYQIKAKINNEHNLIEVHTIIPRTKFVLQE